MPNQVEDAAIAYVRAVEESAGRTVEDTRWKPGAPTDLVCDDRLVEIKAYGGSARGEDLWLEPAQVHAATADPDRFWLYVVDNVRQGDPSKFRLARFGGETLRNLLTRKVERRYFTVPVPVATFDDALVESINHSPGESTSSGFDGQ